MFIEAFVAESTIEALDESVLDGLTWCDVMELDVSIG